jgi:hypothetical protein
MRVIPSSQKAEYQGPRIPKLTAKEHAALAAIEATKARYIPLVCEHYTTLETDLQYSAWRPKKGLSFCETCNAWVKSGRRRAPVQTPMDPLF